MGSVEVSQDLNICKEEDESPTMFEKIDFQNFTDAYTHCEITSKKGFCSQVDKWLQSGSGSLTVKVTSTSLYLLARDNILEQSCISQWVKYK